MIDHRFEYIRNQILFDTLKTKLIFEEVAKLPRTTDTSYVVPDVLELVLQRLLDYD
jgi:hypothetical protein